MFKKLSTEEIVRTDRQDGLMRNVKQIEDMEEVATTTAFTLENTMTTAEMVGYLLVEIEELKDRIEILEEGKK